MFDYSLLKKIMPLVTPFIYNAIIPIIAHNQSWVDYLQIIVHYHTDYKLHVENWL